MKINVVERASKKADENNLTCGKCGDRIRPGQSYRWAKGRYGPKMVRCVKSECAFKPSELTSSDKKARCYDVVEEMEAFDASGMTVDDVQQQLTAWADVIGEVIEEYRDAASHFGDQGPSAEAADELEGWQNEIECADLPEHPMDDAEAVKDDNRESHEFKPDMTKSWEPCLVCGHGSEFVWHLKPEPEEEILTRADDIETWETDVTQLVGDLAGECPV